MVEHFAGCCKGLHKAKRLISGFLIAVITIGTICCAFSETSLSAIAYNHLSAILLMDGENGEVLYAENEKVEMEIASTTKILTAVTVIENSDIFLKTEIPREAVGVEGSSIYLRMGEKWRVLDLLYGLLLRSGNDAAVTLAVITSGSVPAFAEKMNETARKAGATSCNFTNPHGLHDGNHHCSAMDLAKITRYALRCPIFAEICKTKIHHAEKEVDGKMEKVTFYNKNKLLYSYPDATGVKTGYTKHSGRCLVSSAERNGRTLICVVLNVYDTYGVTKTLFEKHFSALSARSEEQIT